MYYVKNIELHFGDRTLFDKISFMIGKKERIGLIGRNGAGKSTLLKVIAGEVRPDEGSVEMPNETTIGYLRQEFELKEDWTVMEETMSCFEKANELDLELTKINDELAHRTDYESDEYHNLIERVSDISAQMEHYDLNTLEAKAVRVLEGLGFKKNEFSKMVHELSGGWKMRIELAKLLLREPDLLLLDEPTNHLDIESILWLEEYLISYSGIVILISHDTLFLNNVTNRILEIELSRLNDFKGSYFKYIDEKAKNREILLNSYENQQKVIAQKEKTINRFMAKANKTKMAQSMKKQLDKVERIEIPDEHNAVMNIRFAEVPRSGRIVLQGKNISKSYDGVPVLKNVDVAIERGNRIAFVGQNGQGKTTLAKILMKLIDADGGEIEHGHNLHLSYYAQNQSELLDSKKTILQVMEEKAPEHLRSKARSVLGSFMFIGDDVDKKVSVLSGGERARLALASLILHPANILVLDEPTNHLDIQSKDILKNALMQYEGTLLVVSHDRDFLKGLTEKIIEFKDHKLTDYLGDIEYYLDKKKLDNMREVEKKSTKTKVVVEAPKQEIDHDEQKKLKRRLGYVERDMEKLETQKQSLNERMQDPAFYQDPEFVVVSKKIKDIDDQLSTLMIEWEELADKIVT